MQIIFEDKDFLVLDKPAGIPVHHGIKTKRALTDEILKKYPNIKTVGEKDRPGIVHRLDQNVSGLLLIARTQTGYNYLRKLFEERLIQKEYIALVYGRITKPEGEIRFPIGRSKKHWVKMATTKEGKVAVTHFEVLKNFQQYTLVLVRPQTGRTHQIRVHFSAYGHPLVGDTLYAVTRYRPRKDILRIFLHASKLSFENQKFESPLPADLQNFLNRLY